MIVVDYSFEHWKISFLWLDGGRTDEIHVLSPRPLRRAAVSEAIRGFTGADAGHDKMADVWDAVESRNAYTNDEARFCAVVTDPRGTDPESVVVVQVQNMPTVMVGGALGSGDGNVVDWATWEK